MKGMGSPKAKNFDDFEEYETFDLKFTRRKDNRVMRSIKDYVFAIKRPTPFNEKKITADPWAFFPLSPL